MQIGTSATYTNISRYCNNGTYIAYVDHKYVWKLTLKIHSVMGLEIEVFHDSYFVSIYFLTSACFNATSIGCFNNGFVIGQEIDCFKSVLLTQSICINFCAVRGTNY